MAKKTKKTAEELEAQRDQYGEVVSFRLSRKNQDQAEILRELRNLSRADKVELFTRAMLSYLGKPIRDDNAATAIELHQMLNDMLQVLGEANQLISRLSRGGMVTAQGKQEIEDSAGRRQLTGDFIDKMNQQQRAAKVLRPPSSTEEE
jgi:hypothetical protein